MKFFQRWVKLGCVLAILLGNYSQLALLNLPHAQQNTEIGHSKHVYRRRCIFPWSTEEKMAVTKLSSNNAGATAPNNEAQDVHLNSWIYWVKNNSCDVKYQSLRRAVRKEAAHVLMCICIQAQSTAQTVTLNKLLHDLGSSVCGFGVFVNFFFVLFKPVQFLRASSLKVFCNY